MSIGQGEQIFPVDRVLEQRPNMVLFGGGRRVRAQERRRSTSGRIPGMENFLLRKGRLGFPGEGLAGDQGAVIIIGLREKAMRTHGHQATVVQQQDPV